MKKLKVVYIFPTNKARHFEFMTYDYYKLDWIKNWSTLYIKSYKHNSIEHIILTDPRIVKRGYNKRYDATIASIDCSYYKIFDSEPTKDEIIKVLI